MARQAGVDPEAHEGNARVAEIGRVPPVRSAVEGVRAAEIRRERIPLEKSRCAGARRRVHASRLLAAGEEGRSQGRDGRRLARRLLLSMPRLEVRSRSTRVQGIARADQPGGAAIHGGGRETGHRRRRKNQGGLGMVARVLRRGWEWFDSRMPSARQEWLKHAAAYYAPKNFNFWYYFGSLAGMVLIIQIVSGIFLTMNYKPDAALAFGSVEYIMRDVPGGWIIRYLHSTGASAFFIVVYLHMWRGLIYGSYRQPRELVWLFGCGIFLCLMAEAFMGYLLPWGQMSYWGAQVIVNLFSAVPFIGPDLSLLIRGDYVVGDATLNRFFSFHVIAVPLVLLGLVVAHLIALHEVGSNNPDGIEIKANRGPDGHPVDGIPSHPYYTVHDIFGVVVFLTIFSAVIFFAPEAGGYFLEYNNFIPADSLKTPNHIAPVWY